MEFNDSMLTSCFNDLTLATAPKRQKWVTLHCERCRTVLGDSRSVCGDFMDSIICMGVTRDVVISGEMQLGHEGRMTDCIFSSLRCRHCCCAVGKIIHSAPSHLAMIRSLFLLHKSSINCYILNSCSMVKASTFVFDVKPLEESISEARLRFEALSNQMSRIKSRLAGRGDASELDK